MIQTTYQLLTFFESVENVKGRKKLQKMIHLLQNANINFPYKYEYHHYGPYSSSLQYEVNDLTEQGFVQEENRDGMYVYTLTEKGKEFKYFLEQTGQLHFSLDKALLEKLSEESSQFLEVVSTYAFLIESGDTEEQAEQNTRKLKPHLKRHLEEAIKFYKQHIVN